MSCPSSSKPEGHCVAFALREKVRGVLPYAFTHSHTPAHTTGVVGCASLALNNRDKSTANGLAAGGLAAAQQTHSATCSAQQAIQIVHPCSLVAMLLSTRSVVCWQSGTCAQREV